MELTLNMEQEGRAGVALQTNKEKGARFDSPAYSDCMLQFGHSKKNKQEKKALLLL
jgi:hypothetical protein